MVHTYVLSLELGIYGLCITPCVLLFEGKLRISVKESSGGGTFLFETANIWLYFSVIVERLWPNSTWNILKFVPDRNKGLAKLCRKVGTIALGLIPLAFIALLNTPCKKLSFPIMTSFTSPYQKKRRGPPENEAATGLAGRSFLLA